MFETLSERLSSVFEGLTKQGALSADDVKTALREVRVARVGKNHNNRETGQTPEGARRQARVDGIP